MHCTVNNHLWRVDYGGDWGGEEEKGVGCIDEETDNLDGARGLIDCTLFLGQDVSILIVPQIYLRDELKVRFSKNYLSCLVRDHLSYGVRVGGENGLKIG